MFLLLFTASLLIMCTFSVKYLHYFCSVIHFELHFFMIIINKASKQIFKKKVKRKTILHLTDFQPGKLDAGFRRWANGSITRVRDFFSIMTFEQMIEKYCIRLAGLLWLPAYKAVLYVIYSITLMENLERSVVIFNLWNDVWPFIS